MARPGQTSTAFDIKVLKNEDGKFTQWAISRTIVNEELAQQALDPPADYDFDTLQTSASIQPNKKKSKSLSKNDNSDIPESSAKLWMKFCSLSGDDRFFEIFGLPRIYVIPVTPDNEFSENGPQNMIVQIGTREPTQPDTHLRGSDDVHFVTTATVHRTEHDDGKDNEKHQRLTTKDVSSSRQKQTKGHGQLNKPKAEEDKPQKRNSHKDHRKDDHRNSDRDPRKKWYAMENKKKRVLRNLHTGMNEYVAFLGKNVGERYAYQHYVPAPRQIVSSSSDGASFLWTATDITKEDDSQKPSVEYRPSEQRAQKSSHVTTRTSASHSQRSSRTAGQSRASADYYSSYAGYHQSMSSATNYAYGYYDYPFYSGSIPVSWRSSYYDRLSVMYPYAIQTQMN